jgi:hypothetical protein
MTSKKHIKLTDVEWDRLKEQIQKDYPPSVLLIRNTMKKVLGFTTRTHSEWVPKMSGGYMDTTICLDFYNEPKRTFFLLKYGDLLEKSGKTTLDF